MPIQKSIYKNDITREIGGVIYSNDDRNLMQELEEYVLTKELLKPRFCRSYLMLLQSKK
jgi:hypothetical protein